MKNVVRSYFEQTKGYSNIRLVVEFLMFGYIFKFIFAFIGALFLMTLGQELPDMEFEKWHATLDPLVALLEVTFFAGIETLIGQAMLLFIAGIFTKKIILRLLFASVVFSAMHLDPFIMITIFPFAVLFTWTYLIRREKSFMEAFWVTTILHSAHNYIAYILTRGFLF